ncbi:MAG: heavy metal-associated domain-containing protein [Pseudomonadota bacterium]
MKHIIDVENIKCGGCAHTIETRLKKLDTVTQVSVNVEQGQVTVEAADNSRTQLVETLLHSGYPEKGTAEGLKAAKAKAKSFVSCAIGKMG